MLYAFENEYELQHGVQQWFPPRGTTVLCSGKSTSFAFSHENLKSKIKKYILNEHHSLKIWITCPMFSDIELNYAQKFKHILEENQAWRIDAEELLRDEMIYEHFLLNFPRFLEIIGNHPNFHSRCFQKVRLFVGMAVAITIKLVRSNDLSFDKNIESKILEKEKDKKNLNTVAISETLDTSGDLNKVEFFEKIYSFLYKNCSDQMFKEIGLFGIDILRAAYATEGERSILVESSALMHKNIINECLNEITIDIVLTKGNFSLKLLKEFEQNPQKTVVEVLGLRRLPRESVSHAKKDMSCSSCHCSLGNIVSRCDTCSGVLCSHCMEFCTSCALSKRKMLSENYKKSINEFQENKKELEKMKSELEMVQSSLQKFKKENELMASDNKEKQRRIFALEKQISKFEKRENDDAEFKKRISELEAILQEKKAFLGKLKEQAEETSSSSFATIDEIVAQRYGNMLVL